jgi:hypothetical protein
MFNRAVVGNVTDEQAFGRPGMERISKIIVDRRRAKYLGKKFTCVSPHPVRCGPGKSLTGSAPPSVPAG